MDKERVKIYLERIGLDESVLNLSGKELLDTLQYAHITHVPYETTEIVDGHLLSLETDDLFKKIVLEKRGGYCFELNGLFAWLLREIGFDVSEHMARFLRGETKPPKHRHRIPVIKLDNMKVLCDVGVGCKAPRKSIDIEKNRIQDVCGEKYKFDYDDFLGWILLELNNDKWEPYFSFTEEQHINNDYYTLSYYCEKNPESPFICNMLSLKNDEGRVTIDKNEFRIWKGDNIVESRVLTEDELELVCRKYFGMSLHR